MLAGIPYVKKTMYVIKRDGRHEAVKFDKITARVKKLCYGLNPLVDPVSVSQTVCQGIYKGVTTSELDELAAKNAADRTIEHPDYAILASRIAVSNLHKQVPKTFTKVIQALHTYIHPITKEPASMISQDVHDFVMRHQDELNGAIVHDRDFQYDYFGFKTLEKTYLLRTNEAIAERPQHMLMRVACGIHCPFIHYPAGEYNPVVVKAGNVEEASDVSMQMAESKAETAAIAAVLETYKYMSERWFTHATPTLFNAGNPNRN